MLERYIDKLRASGRVSFTREQLRNDLGMSDDAVNSGLYRMKKGGRLISPLKGLYVVVPVEDRVYGSIPAQDLVPIVMEHLGANYYVGLLSAGLYYGATHQKPARFQVILDKRVKHLMRFGRVSLEMIYKGSVKGLPVKDVVVNTGYLKVAQPELVVIDLFNYDRRAGGISHIATVLSELIPSVDVDKLIELAQELGQLCQLQRLGYILERIDVMEDEQKKEFIVDRLARYFRKVRRPYVLLVPSMGKVGFPRNKKWRVVENSDFESDL